MNQLATYSLGTVLRETGINADTLRAWERRYDLPTPERSAGGHRLYSERDLAIIKWLLLQQENGIRIGQAVKIWRSKIAAGEDPLNEAIVPMPNNLLEQSHLDSFRTQWVAACIDYDEAKAEQIASQAFTRFSPELSFTEIFLPGIREIGELWYQGKVTVQQEHFASALLMRRLNALISTSPAPTRAEKIIVACPPKEEHTLSSLLLTLFLRRRGFHVVYLGTNVPLEEFQETVDVIQPQLVLFTAQLLNTAATLEQTVRALANNHVTIGYIGRVFLSTPSIQQYIHGDFLGPSFSDIFANIEMILARKEKEVFTLPANPHQELLDSFEVDRAGIHAHLNGELAQWKFPLKLLIDATEELSEKIQAALYLGDLDLLLPELVWVKELLKHRNVDASVSLAYFLRAYAKATHDVMGEKSAQLVDWLEAQSLVYA